MRKPLLLAGLFFAGAFLNPLAAAVSETEKMQARLGIPVTLAEVTDAAGIGRRPPDFVVVQDVHQHPEVQGEITAILLFARRRWPVNTVFVEGAFSEVRLASVRPQERFPSLGKSLREGRLSGPEMAALMSDGELTLIGMEHLDLYRSNLQAFNQVVGRQEEAFKELNALRLIATGLDLANARYSKNELDRMQKLVSLQLRPGDYENYRAAPVKRPHSPALSNAITHAERFYQLADERSHYFLDHVQDFETKGPRVLVVGGFHTALMARLLRQAGRSYAVVTPRVTMAQDDRFYRERMRASVSALKLP
jgi:hypothetical protein